MTDFNDNDAKVLNRAAYARLEPALQQWRETIEKRVDQAQTCDHIYGWIGNVEACQRCGQTKKLADKED